MELRKKAMAISAAIVLIAASLGLYYVFTTSSSQAIKIDGNNELKDMASKKGWSGSGTAEDPYVISVNMNVTRGSCISISNTTKYITIRDCDLVLYDENKYAEEGTTFAGSAISVLNAKNVVIENNRISSDATGIILSSFFGSRISNNTVSGLREGLLMNFCNDNQIYGNVVNNGSYVAAGLNAELCDHNMFEDNVFSGRGENLISESYHNVLRNNSFSALEAAGLRVEGGGDNVFIDDSYSAHTTGPGMTRGFAGLVVSSCYGNEFINITASGGGYFAIGASFNALSDSEISGGKFYGRIGISMYDSVSNAILRNELHGISEGILMHGSDRNIVSDNSVPMEYNYGAGIRLQGSDENVFTRNVFDTMAYWGYAMNISESVDNLIYDNEFVYSGVEVRTLKLASDDSLNNFWNTTSGGNYWSTWTGPDADSDGIVDLPYMLDGVGVADRLPLVQPVP